MNPEFRPAEVEGADPCAGELHEQAPLDETLLLVNPSGSSELPPEHFDAWLDRLVDGEVAEPQRRALLSRLEQSPDGWRRCALAFLEAQAWREALSPAGMATGDCGTSLASEPMWDEAIQTGLPLSPALFSQGPASKGPASKGPASKGPASKGPASNASPRLVSSVRPFASPRLAWPWRPLLGMVAAAASFALAFGLGLLVHKTWLSPRGGSTGGVIDAAAPGAPSGGGSLEHLAAGTKPPQAGSMKWGAVQFVVDGPEGSPEQVRLPAVDGPDPDQWLREQPPAIPDEIVQELRRRGHHVETQRRYLPVPLDDGRSAVFPVDQVEVRFRGGKGYQ